MPRRWLRVKNRVHLRCQQLPSFALWHRSDSAFVVRSSHGVHELYKRRRRALLCVVFVLHLLAEQNPRCWIPDIDLDRPAIEIGREGLAVMTSNRPGTRGIVPEDGPEADVVTAGLQVSPHGRTGCPGGRRHLPEVCVWALPKTLLRIQGWAKPCQHREPDDKAFSIHAGASGLS